MGDNANWGSPQCDSGSAIWSHAPPTRSRPIFFVCSQQVRLGQVYYSLSAKICDHG
jgi:hypothetical protein